MTVGAENLLGNQGTQIYYADPFEDRPADPDSELPTPSPDYEVAVTTLPGGTHTVTYEAAAVEVGDWENTAIMFSEVFRGNATAVFTGEVIPMPS